MNYVCLLVEVPVCAFRPYASREYQDTYPVPTPTAVYGMLLSLIGLERERMSTHRGVEMVLAVEQEPHSCRVFRKLRRGDDLESRRPDYQDVLIDVRLWIWLRRGDDEATPCLRERVTDALWNPELISRSGGLSLGESSYMIDTISDRKQPPDKLIFLKPNKEGFYSLPVWVDHSDASNTISARFSIGEPQLVEQVLPSAWFKIGIP